MAIQLINLRCIWVLMYIIAASSCLSAQASDTTLLFNQICINGVAVQQNPAFLDEIEYNFKLTEYEEEDVELVGTYFYYKSDSLDITFESYQGVISLSSIVVKCYECSISCGGPDIALGSSVTKVIDNYQNLFMAYAENYYPQIIENHGVEAIPDFALDFQTHHPQKEISPNGILLFRFEERRVKEIFIRFIAE